jgi:hypothetical protein
MVMGNALHRLLILTLAAFLTVGAVQVRAQSSAATVFIDGMDDLPLMKGLEEAPEGALAFHTPLGRIVEAYASGPVTKDQVLNFYAATLPQLGWLSQKPTEFRREGEILRLDFPKKEGADVLADFLTVRFALSPETGGAKTKP